jgi:endoglycosylceramidase
LRRRYCHPITRRINFLGFPDWAISDNGKKPLPFALPIHRILDIDKSNGLPIGCWNYAWASFYLTDAVGKAFQGLYSNYQGLLDEFTKFWTKVSTANSKRTSVLGYEIINEPWCGDIYSDPGYLFFDTLHFIYGRNVPSTK